MSGDATLSGDTTLPGDATLRPSDADAVRAELRATQRVTGLPVAFGGLVADDLLPLSGFVGTRGAQLRGLVISARCGLGGRTIAERRPGTVVGYADSAAITHEYDVEVASEGIETLIAAPAVVGGRARAVLYGGLRNAICVGDQVLGLMNHAARRLAREFEVRDEVDRRLALIGGAEAAGPRSTELSDRITEGVVALRELAATTADADLAARLLDIGATLYGAAPAAPGAITLSPRETDVLAYVALGCPNAEIARRLGLRPESVKSYLRSVFGKLDVHNRREAVVVARRLGLLP